MATNQSTTRKLIYPELSYLIVGLCFQVHNELGRFSREKQYADSLENKIKEIKLPYKRELRVGDSGNIVDFLFDDKILLDLKAKRIVIKEDYYQIQRYLQLLAIRLGIIINFRSHYLTPKRVVLIETEAKYKFI